MDHFVCQAFSIFLVMYAAFTVEGADVAYNGDCSAADAVCNEALNACISDVCACATTAFRKGSACVAHYTPLTDCVTTDVCVTHATCDTTTTNKCQCDAGYTASPTTTPTMCNANGVVKFATMPYMYLVPILVSMMSLLR